MKILRTIEVMEVDEVRYTLKISPGKIETIVGDWFTDSEGQYHCIGMTDEVEQHLGIFLDKISAQDKELQNARDVIVRKQDKIKLLERKSQIAIDALSECRKRLEHKKPATFIDVVKGWLKR